ncbi:MAG: DUF58 domain-containing protein [Endomicrobium sp.]|jgi:uncharacterized protein (DUF58 family)|nr:DUF58 domain-containing protein [Endomicrobium sp.]
MFEKNVLLKKQIRQLEIRSKKFVNDIFAGQYQSVFKGRGIEFSEVREYQIGDDFRDIDQNVTARYGKPFVKLFAEERELTVIFLIDVSASQNFGSFDKVKSEIAAGVSALLAFSSLKNNDRTGMLSFTDKIEKIVRPRKGKNNILRIIEEILNSNPSGVKTSISAALKVLNEIWNKKAVVFLISDFQDNGYERDLVITAKRHDLICIRIEDEREVNIPKIGLVEIKDSETGEIITRDVSSLADTFKKKALDFRKKTDAVFKKAEVGVIDLNTNDSYVKPIIRFFKERKMKAGLR